MTRPGGYASGLLVSGLVRLTGLATHVRRSHAEPAGSAGSAVTTERLRFARDLHDLLGYSLSTIILKCELANRLAPRDPLRAQRELAEVLRTGRQALADVRTVARGYRRMSLADEAESARATLTAARVRAAVRVGARPLPPEVDTVLATVLREGLTNMLRHSKAANCVITTTRTGNTVRLRLVNDGATQQPGPADPEGGLDNLASRVTRLGGTLDAHHEGEWFHLTAELPLTRAGTSGRRWARRRAESVQPAVTAERLRFARDLDERLGRGLSLIVRRCERVHGLVPRDAARAQREIADILRISRRTLAEVRAVARGYREAGAPRGAEC
ncbi:histidine kinase [Streptantibioticus parmotrematis]|uniref:sensor histidine kinase n=1 Tax=Streptantibioticus parmotrematis TaxID=2873249 RepID=UPI00340ED742